MKDTPNNKDTGVMIGYIVPSVSIRRNLLAPIFFVVWFFFPSHFALDPLNLTPRSVTSVGLSYYFLSAVKAARPESQQGEAERGRKNRISESTLRVNLQKKIHLSG